jgi:hypothetical protein
MFSRRKRKSGVRVGYEGKGNDINTPPTIIINYLILFNSWPLIKFMKA